MLEELDVCRNLHILVLVTGHEELGFKLLSPLGVNAPRLLWTWFWRMGLVASRFYCLEASPKGSSLEGFPILLKNKNKNKNRSLIRNIPKQVFVYCKRCEHPKPSDI